MTRNEIIRFVIFRTLGNFFILFTIFGFIATFGPALYFEANYRIANAYGVTYALDEDSNTPNFGMILDRRRQAKEEARQAAEDAFVTDPTEGLFEAIMTGKKEQTIMPPDTNFSVVIPKIGASQAIAENVDPSDENEFNEILKNSIAHAQGSAFPGLKGNTYLFAHSASTFWDVGRYNAVFYLLKELKQGDEIYVFYEGKRYNYEVDTTKIVDAEDTSYISANLGQGEMLTLQTCWPPGTTWKRLLVFAKPKTI